MRHCFIDLLRLSSWCLRTSFERVRVEVVEGRRKTEHEGKKRMGILILLSMGGHLFIFIRGKVPFFSCFLFLFLFLVLKLLTHVSDRVVEFNGMRCESDHWRLRRTMGINFYEKLMCLKGCV